MIAAFRGGCCTRCVKPQTDFSNIPSLTACTRVLQLQNAGIGQQFIAFTNVTMESEKFICVRETGATNSVVIIDMANPLSPQKRPITADSALMNPVSKVLALKAAVQPGPGDNLQIFNLDMKAKMKSFAMTEPVVFWKWISASKLGLVTATSVYHWDMNVSPLRLLLAANPALLLAKMQA